MKPTKLFSGTPAVNDIVKFDIGDGDQKTLFVLGGGTFAAHLVVMSNHEKDSSAATDADYSDFTENGLVSFSVDYGVQPVTVKGAFAVKFTTISGNVDVFCY